MTQKSFGRGSNNLAPAAIPRMCGSGKASERPALPIGDPSSIESPSELAESANFRAVDGPEGP